MMKFKFTWPMGIVLSLALFIIFILSFVYKVVFIPKYDHQLVSEQYYKDELNYQSEIDRLNNAKLLDENISLEKSNKGLVINFPKNMNFSEIEGKISFQRPSNIKLDFNLPIALTSNQLFIDKSHMVPGIYELKIDWSYKTKNYLLKQRINF
ncbi:MAG: FixH family protein [Lutibacter sp.]